MKTLSRGTGNRQKQSGGPGRKSELAHKLNAAVCNKCPKNSFIGELKVFAQASVNAWFAGATGEIRYV